MLVHSVDPWQRPRSRAGSQDAACRLHEHRDAAARRPGDPPVQGLLAFPAFDRKHMAQALFEQICPMQAGSVLAIQAGLAVWRSVRSSGWLGRALDTGCSYVQATSSVVLLGGSRAWKVSRAM